MTLRGKVLIVLVIVAATAVGLLLTEAVATSAHQADRQGVVSLHQHGGVAHGAHVFPFVHLARLHRHRSGPTFGGGGGGVVHMNPGRYRVRSWLQRCKHCDSRQPTLVGRRIGGCSHRFRLKAGKRTVIRIRHRGRRPCVIHVRPPYRPH
ncbi:MAG: hypothetical protein ACRDMH_02060 [Solirubrobacterales bacterium]